MPFVSQNPAYGFNPIVVRLAGATPRSSSRTCGSSPFQSHRGSIGRCDLGVGIGAPRRKVGFNPIVVRLAGATYVNVFSVDFKTLVSIPSWFDWPVRLKSLKDDPGWNYMFQSHRGSIGRCDDGKHIGLLTLKDGFNPIVVRLAGATDLFASGDKSRGWVRSCPDLAKRRAREPARCAPVVVSVCQRTTCGCPHLADFRPRQRCGQTPAKRATKPRKQPKTKANPRSDQLGGSLRP